MRNGEWGMRNEEWGMRNKEWGMGNEKLEIEKHKQLFSFGQLFYILIFTNT